MNTWVHSRCYKCHVMITFLSLHVCIPLLLRTFLLSQDSSLDDARYQRPQLINANTGSLISTGSVDYDAGQYLNPPPPHEFAAVSWLMSNPPNAPSTTATSSSRVHPRPGGYEDTTSNRPAKRAFF